MQMAERAILPYLRPYHGFSPPCHRVHILFRLTHYNTLLLLVTLSRLEFDILISRFVDFFLLLCA